MKNYLTLMQLFTKCGTHLLPVKSFYLEPDEIGYKPFVYIRGIEDPVYIPRVHAKMIIDMMTDGITCHEIDNQEVYMSLNGVEEIHDKLYFDISFKKMTEAEYQKHRCFSLYGKTLINSMYGIDAINPYQE